MTIYYTIQVSNHPGAGSRLPTEEAGNSWQTVFDGTLAGGAVEARKTVDRLSQWHRHARVFRGGSVGGKLHYAVLRQ